MKNLFVHGAARRGWLRSALLLGATLHLLNAAPLRAQGTGQPVGVKKVADFSYRVSASNPAALRGTLQLVNSETGAVLYEEFSIKPTFGQQFNVRNLPDGNYAFVVKLGSQRYRYALRLRTTAQRSAELSTDTTRTAGRLSARL